MASDIMEKAISSGAEYIITACAMCQLNLELRARKEQQLPVFSIVELLAYGLGYGIGTIKIKTMRDHY
jgi:heterodisulfide reductase subunit B